VDLFKTKEHPLLTIRFSNPGVGSNRLDTDSHYWPHGIDHSKIF